MLIFISFASDTGRTSSGVCRALISGSVGRIYLQAHAAADALPLPQRREVEKTIMADRYARPYCRFLFLFLFCFSVHGMWLVGSCVARLASLPGPGDRTGVQSDVAS